MKAIDLFCGAGGGSLGLRDAGLDVIGGVDLNEEACQTYEENLNHSTFQADMSEIKFEDILDEFNASEEDIDMLMGCPPCQNFSNLRDTKPWDSDEDKDLLLKAFIQQIKEASPKLVIFENVKGILNTDGGIYMDKLVKSMDKMDYGFKWKLVDATKYGVPQNRERVIGFGVKGWEDEDIHFPKARNNKDRKTVRDAISNLPKLEAGESSDSIPNHKARSHQQKTIERFQYISEDGGSRKEMPKRLWLECHKNLDENGGAESVYSRMWWDKPAPTMTTKCTSPSSGRFIHPSQNRGITVREAARIQTFPDDFVFPDETRHASRLVGNAVPPKLIEEIVSEFLEINGFN